MLNSIPEILTVLSRIEASIGITQDLLRRLLDSSSPLTADGPGNRALETLFLKKGELLMGFLKVALDEGYMSTKEVCAYVGISERTLNRKVKEEMIRSKFTQGVEKYYTKSDVVIFYRIYHRRMPNIMP
ncbi:MerR family transcriptional regulator [Sphingobacterium tabacisoli]|uniref:DNA-binding protein n=1 Tax=Sphingobacterium tabacisoli TaxID=2044855 RepID=A0ABW5KWA1_9SPHI|nr:hypothetical protein [Sphingobacterium tabacisoli]